MGPLHMTFPRSNWQEIVSVPWVLMKPSSQTTEMELPSWKLSPKRRALMGMPGSGHSLWPNAGLKSNKKTQIWWGIYWRLLPQRERKRDTYMKNDRNNRKPVLNRHSQVTFLLIILITFLRTNHIDIWLQRDVQCWPEKCPKMSPVIGLFYSIFLLCLSITLLVSSFLMLQYICTDWFRSKQFNFW